MGVPRARPSKRRPRSDELPSSPGNAYPAPYRPFREKLYSLRKSLFSSQLKGIRCGALWSPGCLGPPGNEANSMVDVSSAKPMASPETSTAQRTLPAQPAGSAPLSFVATFSDADVLQASLQGSAAPAAPGATATGQDARRVAREPGHQRRAGPFRFRPGGHAPQPAAFSVSLGFCARGPGATGGAFSFRRGGCSGGRTRYGCAHGGHQFRESSPAAGRSAKRSGDTFRRNQKKYRAGRERIPASRRPYFPAFSSAPGTASAWPSSATAAGLQTGTEATAEQAGADQAPPPDRAVPDRAKDNCADDGRDGTTTTPATAARSPPRLERDDGTMMSTATGRPRSRALRGGRVSGSKLPAPPRVPLRPPVRRSGGTTATPLPPTAGAAQSDASAPPQSFASLLPASFVAEGQASRTAARQRILLPALRPRRP